MADPAATARTAAAARARRLAVAQALPQAGLDWAALDSCPDWLSQPADARELLSAHAGAWWLAAPLRACIDGKRLARVCDLLGEPRLAALRDAPATARADALDQAPRPLLPPAEDMPRHLLACGQALLAWSLPPAVRGPVLAQLGWRDDAGQHGAFDQHAAWARQALAAALHEPPAAAPSEPGESPQAGDEVLDADAAEIAAHAVQSVTAVIELEPLNNEMDSDMRLIHQDPRPV